MLFNQPVPGDMGRETSTKVVGGEIKEVLVALENWLSALG
jgi:hypothetical protein